MACTKNKVDALDAERTKPGKQKLRKFYPLVVGNTKDCHERIVRKLKKYGAKRVDSREDSDVVVVFCPIVTRFETDINAALEEINPEGATRSYRVIMTAMHLTHNKEYTVPGRKEYQVNGERVPVVHCLFHETKGLLRCPVNKQAVKSIRKEMGIKKYSDRWRRLK